MITLIVIVSSHLLSTSIEARLEKRTMPISRWTSKQLIWFFCLTVVRGAQNDSGFDLVYMEQADTSYMYHILTYAVKNSTFAGNATAGNGQKILVEGPSVPYTTIEFTVLRLRPSDKPMFSEEKIPDYTEEELAEFEADDKLVMEKPPILLSNNHVELENGVKMSFYDYLSTNEHTKDEWADMTEEERNYWKNASFVFQSWCEDPVCPPDESILYKVVVNIFQLLFKTSLTPTDAEYFITKAPVGIKFIIKTASMRRVRARVGGNRDNGHCLGIEFIRGNRGTIYSSIRYLQLFF